MSKVAIVVHRWHPGITGGSETLAWQYASLLSDHYDVELLTTTAKDYHTWENVLPAGVERHEGVTVRRYPVAVGRSPYWTALHRQLLADVEAGCLNWSLAREEEFLRHQGPYSPELVDDLGERWPEYRAIFFVTYLYPNTYFGLERVPRSHAILVPTLHDEPPAYLRALRLMASRARQVLWLTESERRLGGRLWGPLPGRTTAMAVNTTPHLPAPVEAPFIMYSGRIDSSKGCDRLVEDFLRWKRSHPSDVRLVLTGDDKLGLPWHPHVHYLGFVSEEEKFGLMAAARAFVMPSRWESFSVATLEAMGQGVPALVNGECEVLAEHVTTSGGGPCYRDYPSFAAALSALTNGEEVRGEMGARARNYVVARYEAEQVRRALIEATEERSLVGDRAA